MPTFPDEQDDFKDREYSGEDWDNELELLYGEQIPLAQVKDWDDLVSPEEKRDISRLHIKLRALQKQILEQIACPYLRFLDDATYFQYCQQIADLKFKENNNEKRKQGWRYTLQLTPKSIQRLARPTVDSLENWCLNPDKSPKCKYFLLAQEQGKI